MVIVAPLRASSFIPQWTPISAFAFAILVAPLRRVHVLERQRLLVQRGFSDAAELPGRHVEKCSSSRSASPSGVWLSSRKWPPHDSRPVQRIERQQLGELQVVGDAAGVFEVLVQVVLGPGTETFCQNSSRSCGDLASARAAARVAARHPDVVPQSWPELAVECRGVLLALDRQQRVDALLHGTRRLDGRRRRRS